MFISSGPGQEEEIIAGDRPLKSMLRHTRLLYETITFVRYPLFGPNHPARTLLHVLAASETQIICQIFKVTFVKATSL